MQLGEKISQIRRAKGISQDAVAKSLGISTTAYAQIERNESDITISRLQQIAETLGVKEWALFMPEGAVNIIGEIKDNASPTNFQNNFPFADFSKAREAYQVHISDLQKKLQTTETKHEKQVASLERQLEVLQKLLDK
jgi:transcriptional regulator with XRE-family HTH domain